jgi:XisI protein
MERIAILQKAILDVYEEYATYLRGSNYSSVNYQLIIDEKNRHYQLIAVGWENDNRIFSIIFQSDIIDDKIWIQEDNTEDGLAALIGEKGISKKEIVLAYFPEYHRKYTEYAVV